MKKFIIFTFTITGVGGGQLYASQKIRYMENAGYEGFILSSYKNSVTIPSLQKHIEFVIPELITYPYIFSKKKEIEFFHR